MSWWMGIPPTRFSFSIFMREKTQFNDVSCTVIFRQITNAVGIVETQ